MTWTKEQKAECAKKYYADHKNGINEYRRTYNALRKEAVNEQARIRYANNPELRDRSHIRAVQWQRDHKEQYDAKHRISSRLWKHNISLDEYSELFIKQDGRCAICGKHQSEFTKELHIDHDHENEKIRGLLCENCNIAIGLMKDDTAILLAAIKYLEK